MERPVIAIIEDEPTVLMMMDELLTDEGYATILITQGKNAHQILRQVQPDLIILDLHLEHPKAGEMVLGLLEIDAQTKDIPVIICSANLGLPEYRADLLRGKGYMLLDKPFDTTELLEKVAQGIQQAPPP